MVETVGTSGNDTIRGIISDNATDDTSTYNSGDAIKGGAGTDTLELQLEDDGNADFGVVTMESVEVVKLRALDAGGAGTDVDAALWTGVTKVVADAPVSGTGVAGITGLANNATLALNKVAGGDGLEMTFAAGAVGANGTLTIETTDSQTAGTTAATNATPVAAELTVNLQGTDSVTALNIAATGANRVVLDVANGATVAALESITVTGAGTINLTDNATELDTVDTIDASANTGGLTVDISAVTTDISVKGGSGKDAITVDISGAATIDLGAGDDTLTFAAALANGDLTSADSIKGGEGTDTLVANVTDFNDLDADTDLATAITGFEKIQTNDAWGAFTVNASKFGVNYVKVGNNVTNAAATVTGLTDGATIEIGSATAATITDMTNALVVTMTGANTNTNDTLNIKLNDNLVSGNTSADMKLDVAGINNLVVTTADAYNGDNDTDETDGYALVLTNDANVKTITVSGDKAFTYASSGTDAALTTINASALTGVATIDVSTFTGNEAVTVKTGNQDDVITADGAAEVVVIDAGAGDDQIEGSGNAGDVINAGAGDDVLANGIGISDSITLGAGLDTVAFDDFLAAAVTDGANASSATVVTVTDFVAADDALQFYDSVATGNVAATATNYKEAAAAVDTLAAAAAAAILALDGTVQYSVQFVGSDAYVFFDDGATGGEYDVIVKLVGTNAAGISSADIIA